MLKTELVNLVILAGVPQVRVESQRKASARVSSHRPFIATFVFHYCFIGCIRPWCVSEPVDQK